MNILLRLQNYFICLTKFGELFVLNFLNQSPALLSIFGICQRIVIVTLQDGCEISMQMSKCYRDDLVNVHYLRCVTYSKNNTLENIDNLVLLIIQSQ